MAYAHGGDQVICRL